MIRISYFFALLLFPLGVQARSEPAAVSIPVQAQAQKQACHPAIDPLKPQYTVGYGSLMEDSSRRRTAHNTGEALPVLVSGFERSFNARGSEIGFSTTYLGVTVDPSASMVATVPA